MAEIGQGQHDARAENADANLEGAIDGQDHDAAVAGSDRSENVARKNRCGVAGEGGGIGGEVTQERGDKGADCAPERKSDEKALADPDETRAARITMPIAPTTVPIIRNAALRSEAPSTGWQTIAAVVAAHVGSLSSRAKAT